MKIGDLVIYPSKRDRQIHLGRIEGEFQYDPAAKQGYPQRRAVKWLRTVPRTRFSQGALYEIGSAMSLFLVRNYAEEFRAAVEGEIAAPVNAAEDESVAVVAEDIEQATRDFVIKQLAQVLKGHPFADFVAQLLNCMGYRTRVSEEGPDGGVDIIAHRDALGLEPPIVKVQVKSTEGTVGDPAVSALYGKVTSGEFGLVVALGTFSPHAVGFARSKGNLRLIDGEELVDLIFEHYDKLDSRYKGLLPLRRVYIPEAVGSGGD
jgi:restriction system protein